MPELPLATPKVTPSTIFGALKNFSESLATMHAGGEHMTAGDNFQNNDRVDAPVRANDFATKCSLQAWEPGADKQRLGNQPADSSNLSEQGFLDFAVNDPLLVAQETATPERTTPKDEFENSADEQSALHPSSDAEHHYYQSLFIHKGDTQHGLKARLHDPGHAAIQVEDTGTGFKSKILGLSPDGSALIHPIRTAGHLDSDDDYTKFDMQVRREISKAEFDHMSTTVQEEIDKGDIGYGVLFPKQCTTEAIRLSSFGGWAIETPKEKVAPFLPAQVTPDSLYDTFSKPQSLDLTNLNEAGKPRPIEVYLLAPGSKNNRNFDAFEDSQ